MGPRLAGPRARRVGGPRPGTPVRRQRRRRLHTERRRAAHLVGAVEVGRGVRGEPGLRLPGESTGRPLLGGGGSAAAAGVEGKAGWETAHGAVPLSRV